MFFEDRSHAARVLADELAEHVPALETVFLGLSYGGLVIAGEVARTLRAEVDSFLCAKGGDATTFVRVRRMPLRGRVVVAIDDGAATGDTVVRAVGELWKLGPARLVVALPVAPAATCARIQPLVDELICPRRPTEFLALKACYAHFPDVKPSEAVRALKIVPLSEHVVRPEWNGALPSTSVTASMRAVCDRLENGLDEIERAIVTDQLAAARELLVAWRHRLAHHLAWEENAVLPEFERNCGAAPELRAEHATIHHRMLRVADELASELGRRSHIVSGSGWHLLAALKRHLAIHRDREIGGLGGALEAAGARLVAHAGSVS